MLVLARRSGESLVIDGRITVTVLGVSKNGHVRLGIEAPREVRVIRNELLAEIRVENQHAVSAGAASQAAALSALLPLASTASAATQGSVNLR